MLPLLEFAYNNSKHSTTGITPFEAIQGSRPVVPAALLVPVQQTRAAPKEYAEEVAQRLQRIYETIRATEQQATADTKRREDRKKGYPKFAEGEEVLCRYFPQLFGGPQRKQHFTYHGPYLVKRVIGTGVAVELTGLPAGMPTTINVEHVRKYQRDEDAVELRQQTPPPKAMQDEEGNLVWEVEDIKDHRWRANKLEYKVK